MRGPSWIVKFSNQTNNKTILIRGTKVFHEHLFLGIVLEISFEGMKSFKGKPFNS